MDSVEAEGSSIDEAIDRALKTLGTNRDRVEIEILSNSARGLFGIGGRKAKVRATLRSPLQADASAAPLRSVDADRPPVRARAAAGGPIAERAAHALQEIMRLMQIDATVSARAEDERIVLELSGDSSGVLIGRRGQMLDALEYLLNRLIGHDEGASPRIVVDSENYRARRRESLEELARRMGDQAKKKRKPITLNPMSPRDRRIVHMVLGEDPSLTTKSSGKGYFRRLIIIPAGTERVTRGDG